MQVGACKICGAKHNTLLHLSKSAITVGRNSGKTLQSTSEGKAIFTHSSTSVNSDVLLSTAVVYIIAKDGSRQQCRVLLDSGSQANFITQSCIYKLKLSPHPVNMTVSGINGTTITASQVVHIQLRSRLNNFSFTMECTVTNKITERLPTNHINRKRIHISQNIKLADPYFHRSSDIDV